jgi:O-antigen ligase/tetratricopeptide (TPR) repeat protein
MILWLDRLLLAGLLFLVVFSPLAIGSVNPWAFCTVEAVIFSLAIVWMVRLAVEDAPQSFGGMRPFLTPALLFVGLVIFQLLPLPPAVERLVSPSTYRLYATSLPGWPERDPYPEPAVAPSSPAHPARQMGSAGANLRWRPISIAPRLTGASLLKVLSYGCLFFLVLFYPLKSYQHPGGERRFCRRLLKTILITGVAVAALGLLEQTFWNGAILWTYVPYDWGEPRPGLAPRALGPFVDPDHFAAYLNLILPLALAGALFETFLGRRPSSHEPIRLLCLGGATVLICAIALSLSRGGWIGGAVSVSMVIGVALFGAWRERWGRGRSRLRVPGAFYVLAIVCTVAVAAVYTAPSAPTAIDTRVEATLSEPDFLSRLGYWHDALGMIRDFPALGVGLGCFQDLFPRYQSPPWSPYSVREAHNDYVELATEAGVTGLALALWFFLAAGIRIYRGLKTVHSEALPIVVALLAGLAAMAVQEIVDFPLQIPCNAVLFTICVAVTLRLCGARRIEGHEKSYVASSVRLFALGTALAMLVLIVVTVRQDQTPYPYLSSVPHDRRTAQALILEHPARSAPHLWYVAMDRDSATVQLRELAIAAWLDPINPLILDHYAQALALSNQPGRAMATLTRSVFVYPAMTEHFYFEPDQVPWLSAQERKAIDAGFKMAVADKFDGAAPAYAQFCAAVHHDAAEGDVLMQVSSATDRPAYRASLLIQAGNAYLQAGERGQAESAFEQAARAEPSNSQSYEDLATEIYAPRKDAESAKAAIQRGLDNGADPFALYLSLARVYEQTGDLDAAERALEATVKLRSDGSYDYDIVMRLADLERRVNHVQKALLWARRATAIRPGSADALYQLALDEEADYEYGAALRDLARSIKLAPDNAGMRVHYKELLRMIAAYSDHNHRQ